jgi:hypothetical protein
MFDVEQLVVSNEDFPRYLEHLGPFIVMVDESIKKANYPPEAWKGMTPFERANNHFLYAVSAVQIRSDEGDASEAQERLIELRTRLVDSSRLLFDRGDPFWHSTNALRHLYGDDDELMERSEKAFQGICAAINEHCDFHVAVTSCAENLTKIDATYIDARERSFEGALRQLSKPSPLIVADAITAGPTMSERRREAIMTHDMRMIANSRRAANHPSVLDPQSRLRYVSQGADPILWAADVVALAGRMYANRDDTLLSQLASDPRDVVTITNQAPVSQIKEVSKVQQLRDARARLEQVMRERRAAPKPQRRTPPPAPAPPPRPHRPRRPDDPSQRGPSLH